MNRFVIWGKGKLGLMTSAFIEKDWIDCFVDERAFKGEIINGIKVISPSDFWKLDYSKSVIIITPRNYEEEISEKLLSHGITNFYKFSNIGSDVEWITKQLEKRYLLKYFEKNESIILNHNNIISLLIGNILEDSGIDVSYGDDNNANINVDELKIFFFDSKYYYKKEIEQFKNKYKDCKRCFIIGTGPSLRMSDLDILKCNSEICISVNSIFKAFNETEWRPDYYMISDPSATILWREQIENMSTTATFIADGAWCINKKKNNYYKWHFVRDEKAEPKFSDDFAKESFCGNTIIYDGALQLAVYMGFKEIILLGTDCTIDNTSKESEHFYGKEKKQAEKSHLHIPEIFRAYAVAKEYADSHGIKIYNATRGGNLEIFERVDFDSLF